MTSETVQVILPLPSGLLSPNHQAGSIGGRMAKAAAAKKHRNKSRLITLDSKIESGPWKLASVAATFYFATKRRRDTDNYTAMLKPAYDGLVDAGLLVDDDYEHLKREEPKFLMDRKFPRVELVITRRG